MTSRTRQLPRRRGALVAVVLSVVAALLLSGCAERESGAAVVVGDRRITVPQVQKAFEDITALVGQDQQVSQTDILYLLIMEPTFVGAAAAAGDGVSDQDAVQQFNALNSDGTPRFTNPSTLTVLRSSFAQLKVLSAKPQEDRVPYLQQLNAQVKAQGVDINPRYGGTLSTSDSLGIDPATPNWLVQPTPSASPSAPAATP